MNYEDFLKNKYNKTTLTIEELSDELGVTIRMIQNRVRACSNEIPPFKKIGRITVFPIKEVAKFLDSGLVKVA